MSEIESSQQFLVSVILPVFNSEMFVQDAIDSVLAQSLTNFELIIIDDGSSDSSVSIVRSAIVSDDRARLICLDTCSGGPATSRNAGLKVATGCYIAFIDADDQWHPEKLERQLSAIQRHGLGLISSNFRLLTGKSKLSWPPLNESGGVSRFTHQMMLHKNRVVTSSTVVSAKVLKGLSFN
jgi:teichuronic acid biosynthesis glycosyltransferase TuaG